MYVILRASEIHEIEIIKEFMQENLICGELAVNKAEVDKLDHFFAVQKDYKVAEIEKLVPRK